MTSNFSEHTNANYFLHTGTGLQGRPSMGAWVDLRPRQRVPGPARLRRPQRRPDPARRARQLQQRLPAGQRIRARSSSPTATPVANVAPHRSRRPSCSSSKLDLLQQARPRRRSSGIGDDRRARVGHRQLRAGLPHADRRARADGPQRTRPPRRSSCTASTPSTPHTQIFGRAVPARPAAGRARRAVHRADLPERRRRPLGPARRT